MHFNIAPEPFEKLKLIDGATAFEPAGAEPRTEAAPTRGRAAKPLPCVSEVTTPTGKKPVLKAMITTACERNCFYCPFRAGRSRTQRITFSPDEMAQTYSTMERSGVVDGLFLSSGILKGGVSTQEKILDTAEILRKKYAYRGYIHLKVMPGAERDQVRRAMQLADRISVNLEGATEERLARLAPKKDFWGELVQRLRWASELRSEERLRASIVTQFVVGAVGDTDVELMQMSELLTRQYQLRRNYYSAFRPVAQTPFEELAPTSDLREFRLYQASFLLRDYGWSAEELPFQRDGNLPLHLDPKRAWAEEHLRLQPVEINRAGRNDLQRIPGIGPKIADRIVRARGKGSFTELSHLTALGVRNVEQSSQFILLNGRRPLQQLALF